MNFILFTVYEFPCLDELAIQVFNNELGDLAAANQYFLMTIKRLNLLKGSTFQRIKIVEDCSSPGKDRMKAEVSTLGWGVFRFGDILSI